MSPFESFGSFGRLYKVSTASTVVPMCTDNHIMISPVALVLSIALSACTAVSADAPSSSDSRGQARLVAVFSGSANGAVKFVPYGKDGTVYIPSNLENLPSQGGPFSYSIRQGRVGQDGSCANTGDMFDPYSGSADASSNAGKPVGDLSGKYGTIDRQYLNQRNHDSYVSLDPNNKAYIGNKLVVLFDKDGNRIACANINQDNDDDTDSDDDDDDNQSRTNSQRNGHQQRTSSTLSSSSTSSTSSTSKTSSALSTSTGLNISPMNASLSPQASSSSETSRSSTTRSSSGTSNASTATSASATSSASNTSSTSRSSSSSSVGGVGQATGMSVVAIIVAALL